MKRRWMWPMMPSSSEIAEMIAAIAPSGRGTEHGDPPDIRQAHYQAAYARQIQEGRKRWDKFADLVVQWEDVVGDWDLSKRLAESGVTPAEFSRAISVAQLRSYGLGPRTIERTAEAMGLPLKGLH